MVEGREQRLCDTCAAIFSTPTESPKGTRPRWYGNHHQTKADIMASAEQGCYICVRIKGEFTGGNRLEKYSFNGPMTHRVKVLDDDSFKVRLSVELESPGDGYGVEWIRKFYLFPKKTFDEAGGNTKLPPGMRSTESLRQAKGWLEQCCCYHQKCRKPDREIRLPSRLIAIERVGSELKARLCDSHSLLSGASYMTLSHSWGSKTFLTTTRELVEDFKSFIPVSLLPQTFQDAMYVTLELGLQYLWIDSVCIVQDDIEDWERESLRMGEVYMNATCNLTAATVEDGVEGFLPKQRPPGHESPSVNINWMYHAQDKIRRYSNEQYILTELRPWSDIWEGILFDRAWVLQEQVLAPRALHFGTAEMFWECKELFANEMWPLGWAHPAAHSLLSEAFSAARKSEPFWQFSLENILSMQEPPYDVWRKLVKNYSSRQLTYSSDRYLAIRGIASQFGHIVEDRLIWGLWSGDLLRGLLWEENVFNKHWSYVEANSEPTQAPTWSWVHINHPVKWYKAAKLSKRVGWNARELGEVSLPLDGDPDLAVLAVKGPLLLFDFRQHEERDWGYIDLTRGIVSCKAETGFEFIFDINPRHLSTVIDPETQAASKTGVRRPEELLDKLPFIFILPLLYYEPHWSPPFASRALILQRVKERGQGTFRRIGSATIWLGEQKIEKKDDKIDFERYQKDILRDDCKEKDDNGNFTIKLI